MYTKIVGINFSMLDLYDQDFSGSTFEDCDFRFADLSTVVAVDTKFIRCQFLNAVFNNTHWIRPEFIDSPDLDDSVVVDAFVDPLFRLT